MNEPSPTERFEWLEAGRALGDLSPAEEAEWNELAESFAAAGEKKISLDAIVGALESELSPSAELPMECVEKIAEDAREIEQDRTVVSVPRSFWRHPALGWAVAGGFIFLLGVTTLRKDAEPRPVSAENLAIELREDPQALSLNLDQAGGAGSVGSVVWSDKRQQGVLLLSGIPANRPTESQYQLWIVDADRDDKHPVDGGVFNIPREDGTVAIRIDAKLRVDRPSVFVITEEQPGGVVVSKQERVIAVAQL